MSFAESVQTCFRKYADFSGRARRSEYWWFALFSFIVYLVATLIDVAIRTQIFTVIAFLGLLLPSLAVMVRRLHDTGRSGWWWLIGLVPFVGGIVLLVFECLDSEPGPNRFGPYPKPVAPGPSWRQQPPAPPNWS